VSGRKKRFPTHRSSGPPQSSGGKRKEEVATEEWEKGEKEEDYWSRTGGYTRDKRSMEWEGNK